MAEKMTRVQTADGVMPVFIVHPDQGGPFPTAVLYQDGVGFREQVKDNARRLAAGGFFCAAPDLFYRAGEGLHFDFATLATLGADSPERERMMSTVRTVTPERVATDTRALLAAIVSEREAAPGPKVCVGYCMGARMALHIAATLPDEFVAAAGIHPGALVTDQADSPHHELSRVRAELYFAFAENDRTATPELIDRFRDEMSRQGVRGVVERLPGTSHGFAMADLPVYDRDAAERHFERTLGLWRRNLEQQPTGIRG
ncbi:MAG TPA: dienelactone hydrolase family protein [Candidatus Dormibacteraeota bacterium]|nr:dienelactone hydrolase family protein [Candidatus Dormibacteraeota bacterium]